MKLINRIRYALSAWGGFAPAMIIGAFLLKRWTDLGVLPSVIALVFLIDGIIEIFGDPIMGWISDHTKTRWGRRRPLMWLGAILLPLALAGQFSGWIWCVFLFNISNALILVPWGALPAEMTKSLDEKRRLVTSGNISARLSELVAAATAGIIASTFGWFWGMFIIGSFFAGLTLLAPKETCPHKNPREKMQVLLILKDLDFWKFLAHALPGAVLLGISVALVPFYTWNPAITLPIALIMASISSPLVSWISGKIGYKKTLIGGMVINSLGVLALIFLTGNPIADIIIMAIHGFGFSAFFVCSHGLLIETQKSGLEAQYYGVWRMFFRGIDNVAIAILALLI